MATAVIIAVLIMLAASGPLAAFVDRHPTIKMLALSFLLLIGTTLVADGIGFHVPKGYIYAAIGFSVMVEALNQIAARRRRRVRAAPDTRRQSAAAVGPRSARHGRILRLRSAAHPARRGTVGSLSDYLRRAIALMSTVAAREPSRGTDARTQRPDHAVSGPAPRHVRAAQEGRGLPPARLCRGVRPVDVRRTARGGRRRRRRQDAGAGRRRPLFQ